VLGSIGMLKIYQYFKHEVPEQIVVFIRHWTIFASVRKEQNRQ
jgi:hypothetical protein